MSKDLIGLSLTSLFNDFCHEMTTALLPAFTEQLIGIEKAPLALGIIMGFADASATFMKLLSGWLADHISFYKPVLIAGYLITSVFVSLIGTATNFFQIFIYQTLAWLGKGLREPVRDVWLTNITDPSNYGKVFGFERALDTLGAIAGPLLAFFTIKLFALKYNFYIAFIPGIISVLTVTFLTSNYKAPARQSQQHTLKEHINTLPAAFNFFVLVMFIFGIANFNKTLIIYRAQQMLLGEATSSIIATGWAILLYVLFNIIRAMGEFGIGSLSDYVHKKLLLASGIVFFCLATLMMIFASSELYLWVLIFMSAGLSAGIIGAVEKAYAAELLPAHIRGLGFGFLQSIDGIGDLLSSAIVGGLWSFISPEVSFIYALVLSIFSLILILFVRR